MNDELETRNSKLATRKESETTKRWVRRLLLAIMAVIATANLFALRECRRVGGDWDFAEQMVAHKFDTFYLRSPLTIYFNQAVYHFVLKPLGWSSPDPEIDRQWRAKAVGVCSAMGGGIFVATLIAISTNWFFLLFNLSAPLIFIFLGHVEHYAWVNALLAVYFLAVKRHLENNSPLWLALGWFLLAASFHMLAVFYAPSFLFLLAEREPTTGRWHWRQSRKEREILLIIFIVWALALCVAQMVLFVAGLDNGISRLVPLSLPDAPTHYRFSLFSLAHLKMWLYFHWKVSPLGLVLLALFFRTIRTRFDKFLLVATACGFFWTWMWHPDRGERDWDLFANLALPMNILVGLLLARWTQRLSWPMNNER